jgi:hypothetical protein
MDIGIGIAAIGMLLCFACMAMMVGMGAGMARRLFRRKDDSNQEITDPS